MPSTGASGVGSRRCSPSSARATRPRSRCAGGWAWSRRAARRATTARSSSCSGSGGRWPRSPPPRDNLGVMPRWVGFLRRTPCLVLLVVQLAGVLLYPSMETTPAGRAAFALFGLLVLGLSCSRCGSRRSSDLGGRPVRAALGRPARGVGRLRRPGPVRVVRGLRDGACTCTPPSACWPTCWRRAGDHRRAVRDPRRVHLAGLGVRLPVRGGPGPGPRRFQPGRPGHEVVDGAPLPVVHHPLQHGPLGHHTDLGSRAQRRHARAGRRGVLHRDGGDPARLTAECRAPPNGSGPEVDERPGAGPEPQSVRRARTWVVGRAGRARPRRPGGRGRAGGVRAGDQRDPARRPADRGPDRAAPRRIRAWRCTTRPPCPATARS